MVDLDPQGNATMGSAWTSAVAAQSVRRAARIRLRRGGAVLPNNAADVLGANRELAGAEVELVEAGAPRKAPQGGAGRGGCRLRLVLIDCPPSLSMLTLNGLCSAHGVDRAHAVRTTRLKA